MSAQSAARTAQKALAQKGTLAPIQPAAMLAALTAAVGSDVTNGALYFYDSSQAPPSWTSGMQVTARVAESRTATLVFLKP